MFYCVFNKLKTFINLLILQFDGYRQSQGGTSGFHSQETTAPVFTEVCVFSFDLQLDRNHILCYWLYFYFSGFFLSYMPRMF